MLFIPTLNPLITPFSTLVETNMLRISPYLRPLGAQILLVGLPLTRREQLTILVQLHIQARTLILSSKAPYLESLRPHDPMLFQINLEDHPILFPFSIILDCSISLYQHLVQILSSLNKCSLRVRDHVRVDFPQSPNQCFSNELENIHNQTNQHKTPDIFSILLSRDNWIRQTYDKFMEVSITPLS